MAKIYIGLDTATRMGVAIVQGEKVGVMEIKGDPFTQWCALRSLLMSCEPAALVFEKQHNFLNAKTTRNLLERYGFLKYSLLSLHYRVEEVSPKVARHALGVKTKQEMLQLLHPYYHGSRKFTDNHADAAAVALYQMCQDGGKINLECLQITHLLETGVLTP